MPRYRRPVAPPKRPEPPPLEVDDPRIIIAGLLAWVVAGIVLVVLDLTGTSIPGWWHWMTATGSALGVLGVRVVTGRAKRARGV